VDPAFVAAVLTPMMTFVLLKRKQGGC